LITPEILETIFFVCVDKKHVSGGRSVK